MQIVMYSSWERANRAGASLAQGTGRRRLQRRCIHAAPHAAAKKSGQGGKGRPTGSSCQPAAGRAAVLANAWAVCTATCVCVCACGGHMGRGRKKGGGASQYRLSLQQLFSTARAGELQTSAGTGTAGQLALRPIGREPCDRNGGRRALARWLAAAAALSRSSRRGAASGRSPAAVRQLAARELPCWLLRGPASPALGPQPSTA